MSEQQNTIRPLTKISWDAIESVANKFGTWLILSVASCYVVYVLFGVWQEDRTKLDMQRDKMQDLTVKVLDVLQENSYNNARLANSIDKLTEEVRKK